MGLKKEVDAWDALPWQERLAARIGAALVVVGGVAAVGILATIALRVA